MSDDTPRTVEDAFKLIRETRDAMARADKLLSDLSQGKPAILGELVSPTLRLRDRLVGELEELEVLAAKL